jgi:hypothetical protein
MDFLKAAVYILTLQIAVNGVLMMCDEVGMVVITPMNYTQVENALDVDSIVNDFAGEDTQFYDLVRGLTNFYTAASKLVFALPMTLEAGGVPAFIYQPLYLIYLFIFFTAITLGVIAGRQT